VESSAPRVFVVDDISKSFTRDPFNEPALAGGIAAMKRSAIVKLVMMGAGGLSLYAIYRENECRSLPSEQQHSCRSWRSSSNSGARSWSSSSRTTSASTQKSTTSRSGFGSVSRAMSSASRGS
jgi:hypothetical protein